MPTNFDVNAAGAFSVMGTMDGVASRIKTPIFVNNVLRYSHARLSDFFDLFLDNAAKGSPDNFMHVYEWPQSFAGGKPNYKETVGRPEYRLWSHTLSGKASQAMASFVFLPSVRPTPVDPVLLKPGPGGRHVKTGVHVFVFKAMVMEYGLPVEITPKLAKFLAYSIRERSKAGGTDSDEQRHPNLPKDQGGDVMLSKGPVNIPNAGGNKTKRRFTGAFLTWYKTMAPYHMKTDILPQVESDLRKTIELQMAMDARSSIKTGTSNRNKSMNIAAWGSQNQATFVKAKKEAQAALASQEQFWIREAEGRRANLYGNV